MATSDFLENYKLAESTIRKLYDSGLRLAILNALKDKPMRLADLRRAVNANAPNTSSKAKELEEMGLIERVDGDFKLTPYGQAVRSKISGSLEFYSTYEKFREFWDASDLSGIPDFLFTRLGDLNDSRIVKNTPSEVTLSYEYFVEFLKNIKEKFYGVTPIFHKEWVQISEALIKKGVDTRIIGTEKVFELTMQNSSKNFAKLCEENDVKVYLAGDDLAVAFTVTESILSFSLKPKNPPFAYMALDLYSENPRAVKWGLDLFEYYRKQSKPVKLSDFL